MTNDSFDRALMDQMGQLPPVPGELDLCTPWHSAVGRILWGLALCTFRLEVFYLQYLLPLLGATLLYLGYRSLRRENRWFHLGWIMAGIHLAVQMTVLVLGGTPVLNRIGAIPWLNWSLTWALQAVNLLMLLSLRQGSRTAFALLGGGEGDETPPRDWLGRGLVAYVIAIAVALWCELDPCTEPAMLGVTITNGLVYYGRSIAFIILELYLLWCIAQERDVLSGRGYAIAPAPVRLSGRTVLGLVLAVTVAATIPALWLSSRCFVGPAEPLPELSAQQQAAAQNLTALGMDESLVQALSPEELDRCAGAVSVQRAVAFQNGEDTPERQQLEDGTAGELSAYLVELSDGQLRWYYWFDLKEMPGRRIQEVFTVDPSGNYQATDYAARLLWDVDGETQAVLPQVKLAGGKTAEELSEWGRFFASLELERFGYSHYSPWFAFSVPKDAQQARGYLALTVQVPEGEDFTGDFAYAFLHHQIHWLRYPFQSVQALGGTQAVQNKGIARTLWTGVQYYP